MNKIKHATTRWAVAAALVTASLGASPSFGQVVLSDSFDRTLGDPGFFGNPMGMPPTETEIGFSLWGETDNAMGGTAPASRYIVVPDRKNPLQETVNGSEGVIEFGRVGLDYNLAADPTIAAADSVSITVDINPGDTPGEGFNGRDWAGFLLADTKSVVSIGAQFAISSNANLDSRVGIAPRNSGTAIVRRGSANVVAGGNPTSLNEPIFDSDTYNDYVNAFLGGDGSDPGDPVDEFISGAVYTTRIVISKGAGTSTLFEDDAEHLVQYFIRLPGEVTFNQVDPDPSTGTIEEAFFWGDNTQTVGGLRGDLDGDDDVDTDDIAEWALNFGDDEAPLIGDVNNSGKVDASDYAIIRENQGAVFDPTPGASDAYLWFVGNGFDHTFDNLVIEAITASSTSVPEPTSLVVVTTLGGLLLARRGAARR